MAQPGGQYGNKHWMFRLKHGAPRSFESPEEMLETFNDYFKWIAENPLKEAVLQKVKSPGGGEKVKIFSLPKIRIMTVQGFCAFAGCSSQTFYVYEKMAGFSDIIATAKEIMYSQKIEGAAAGLLNPSIIARELGLVDKIEQKQIPYQPIFDDSDPDANEI